MKIENIQASRYRVPVTIPLRDKPRFIDVVLTCVETDTGLRGYSVTDVYGPALTATINEEIAPYLRGANPLETEKIWQDLYTKFNIRCLTGLWSSVASMIDIALWDIKGKHFGEPVFRLLGGAHDRAQAYITFGMGEYSREELVEVAKMLVAQGHTRLKMVVAIQNATNLREDAARVKAVREAVGDGIELMVDANYLFSLPQAVELNCLRQAEKVVGVDHKLDAVAHSFPHRLHPCGIFPQVGGVLDGNNHLEPGVPLGDQHLGNLHQLFPAVFAHAEGDVGLGPVMGAAEQAEHRLAEVLALDVPEGDIDHAGHRTPKAGQAADVELGVKVLPDLLCLQRIGAAQVRSDLLVDRSSEGRPVDIGYAVAP